MFTYIIVYGIVAGIYKLDGRNKNESLFWPRTLYKDMTGKDENKRIN